MKKQRRYIILSLILCCIIMALVETVIQPGYVIKSAIKLACFGGAAVGYALFFRRDFFPTILRPGSLKFALMLGAGIYGVILLGYFLFRPWLDLNAIAGNLLNKEHVTRENFIWVALYISIVNSFLEELLFRGLGYLALRRTMPERKASVISAGLFALYHVSMLAGWFSPLLFVLCMAGLFAGGLIFNALDSRGSILPAWLAHGAANLAINTIGLMMFRIL